ncbi:hypothetical protein [Streptomyces sp. BK340]|uniref:hypothetical protein n=1 Tax=Streptomyces sp. BK340 TaxID=2572903 RepID=UPI0011A73268|nr:hypothetical protein [Streptomyces sp. BK340]
MRGYADQNERVQKQRHMQVLKARLAAVEQKIAAGRPSITVGGRSLARLRHHLADAHLTEADWRQRWEAGRLFLTADGESGAPHGNCTITVDPSDGSVTLVLPEPLQHLANAPQGRYRLAGSVSFQHRHGEWLDRITAHRSVRYDIVCSPSRGKWYLDASWSADKTVLPTLDELKALGARLLGVDLNADHLAAYMLDPHGNPIGEPDHGPAGSDRPHGHPGRSAARRDQRADRPRSQARLRRDSVGRRALGHGIRRRPGVTPAHRRMNTGRATGQAESMPRACGTANPRRTAGTPTQGGKTRPRQGDQLALFPGPQDRSEGHRTISGPVRGELANAGQQPQKR